MNKLVVAPTIQLIPTLAEKIGLNEAIVLQQLHFRLCISEKWRNGEKWVYNTYEDWRKNEFPFWSVDTIYRTIRKLEKEGYVVSTDVYNRMHMDKTKWYRIDYDALAPILLQVADTHEEKADLYMGQNPEASDMNLPQPIPKEVPKKTIKKQQALIEEPLDVTSVIHYLNKSAGKQFNPSSKGAKRLITARFRDGYTVADCKRVIDVKVKEWLGDAKWAKYLRPSTLFNATNFENYLEEARETTQTNELRRPFTVDLTKGEW